MNPPRRLLSRPLRRLAVLAVGLSLLALTPPVVEAQTTVAKLEVARKELKRIEGELKAARARKDQINQGIQSLTTQIAQAYAQKLVIVGHIDLTEGRVTEASAEVAALQERLDERARSAYMAGPANVVQVVLEADSLLDLSNRISFIDVLNQADAALAAGVDTERRQLEGFRLDLDGLRKDQNSLLKGLKRQNERLQAQFQAQSAVEQEIAAKQAEAKKVVETLEAQRAMELLAQFARNTGGRPPPDLGEPGPFYACPVDRPRSYINDFGYPRVGHTHQGNDIFAPRGTPIRAPFDGRAQEGSNGLGGLSVHVYASDGTGDYVYNAHLSRYAGVSGTVQAGDLIGYVGDTGNARGTSPHDHFEYHPGGGGAVTPYFYLNEICGTGGSG